MKRTHLIRNVIQSVVLLIVCIWIFVFKIGTVVSGSMIPAIEVDENVIYCGLFPYNKLEVGDILVYKTDTTLPVVHRVHSVQYDFKDGKTVKRFKMKGDNNMYVDKLTVTEDEYVGKVLYIIKSEKINTLIRTLSGINDLTRLGIALFGVTAWLIAERVITGRFEQNNVCVEKETDSLLVVTELKEDEEHNEERKNSDMDWFYL